MVFVQCYQASSLGYVFSFVLKWLCGSTVDFHLMGWFVKSVCFGLLVCSFVVLNFRLVTIPKDLFQYRQVYVITYKLFYLVDFKS